LAEYEQRSNVVADPTPDRTVSMGNGKPLLISDGDEDKPIVVLLHGAGGTHSHMTDPGPAVGISYDYNSPFPADRAIGWRSYPGFGIWSFQLDSIKDVTGWRPVLWRAGFPTATYDQVSNSALLQPAVDELVDVVRTLNKEMPGPKLVFLTHSRGGLLIRKFIKDRCNTPDLVGRIAYVITLHGPHQGSELANVAVDLKNAIDAVIAAVPASAGALGWLDGQVSSPAYQELRVGGPFITGLANGEPQLPAVEYHTFGGTSVELTRITAWVYTFDSAIPMWHLPPFFHKITMIEIPGLSPILNSLPPLTEEITEGEGDMLVADSRSKLSWGVGQSNQINHAEALWDPNLQAQVLQILGVGINVWL